MNATSKSECASDPIPRSGRKRTVSLTGWILLATALGIILGSILGERAEPFSRIGTGILDLIKGLAGPLLLFAILDAFLRTRIEPRAGGLMVAISLTNATVALALGLLLSNTLRPGAGFPIPLDPTVATALSDLKGAGRSVDPGRTISGLDELIALIPTSLVRPIVENNIIAIVVVATLVGAGLRVARSNAVEADRPGFGALEGVITGLYRVVETLLGWAIWLVPLAIFGVMARTVGRYGLAPIGGLLGYLGVVLLGLGIQVGLIYQGWLILVAKMRLRDFWLGARGPVIYAMGTASSLATLPVTLRSLDRMGVRPESARMAACVGTNLNNDGILLYEAVAVLFVAQASGIALGFSEQITIAGACAIAGIGISGIPEAGLISLIIVVRTAHLPETVVPILLTVDWILGRCRAMTNVISDKLVAVLLDRLSGARLTDETKPPPRSSVKIGVAREKGDDPDGI